MLTQKLTLDNLDYLMGKYTYGYLGDLLRKAKFLVLSDRVDDAKKELAGASTSSVIRSILYNVRIVEVPKVVGVDDHLNVKVSKGKIFSRDYLFNELLVMAWDIKPLYQLDDGERISLHAPQTLMYEGKKYTLISDMDDKSFYWEEGKLPDYIKSWSTLTTGKSKMDLGTGLKRAGMLYDFEGIVDYNNLPKYNKDYGEVVVGNVPDEIDGSQITIWFSEGSYFKGTILSAHKTNMPVGFYGGLKHPDSKTIKMEQKVIAGNVLAIYKYVPFSTNLPMQTIQYAGLKTKVRFNMPRQEVLAKASLGFPSFIKEYNSAINKDWINKIPIKGFAGQCMTKYAPESDWDIMIIGSRVSPKQHGKTIDAALFWSPLLPANTQIPRVRVKCFVGKYENEIFVNVAKKYFAKYIYEKYMGDDFDGDGILIAIEKWLVDQATPYREIELFDTTQFKVPGKSDYKNPEEAIYFASERIRKNSSLIGIYDIAMRRVIMETGPLSKKMRFLGTNAIQSSISAKKKEVHSWLLKSTRWIGKELGYPKKNPDWMKHNNLDNLRDIKKYIKLVNKAFDTGDQKQIKKSISRLFSILDKVKGFEKYKELYANIYKRLMISGADTRGAEVKDKASKAYSLIRESLVISQLNDVAKTADYMRKLSNGNFSDKGMKDAYDRYIKYSMKASLMKSILGRAKIAWVDSPDMYLALTAKILKDFPFYLAGQILSLEEMASVGIFSGIIVPVAREPKFVKGSEIGIGAVNALIPTISVKRITDVTKFKVVSVRKTFSGEIEKSKNHNIKYWLTLAPVEEV